MAIHQYQGAHLEEPVCHKKNKIAFCLLSVPFSAVEDAVSVCGDKSESGGVSGVGKAVPSPELWKGWKRDAATRNSKGLHQQQLHENSLESWVVAVHQVLLRAQSPLHGTLLSINLSKQSSPWSQFVYPNLSCHTMVMHSVSKDSPSSSSHLKKHDMHEHRSLQSSLFQLEQLNSLKMWKTPLNVSAKASPSVILEWVWPPPQFQFAVPCCAFRSFNSGCFYCDIFCTIKTFTLSS